MQLGWSQIQIMSRENIGREELSSVVMMKKTQEGEVCEKRQHLKYQRSSYVAG